VARPDQTSDEMGLMMAEDYDWSEYVDTSKMLRNVNGSQVQTRVQYATPITGHKANKAAGVMVATVIGILLAAVLVHFWSTP